MHFWWEMNSNFTSKTKENEIAYSVTVWGCCCRGTASQEVSYKPYSDIAVMEDGSTHYLCCLNQLSVKFNLYLLLFFFSWWIKVTMNSYTALWLGIVLWFLMLLKPHWFILRLGTPSSFKQVEPFGSQQPLCLDYIPPASPACVATSAFLVLFQLKNILQEKLLSCWRGNAWTGAFYIPMTHSTQPWKFGTACPGCCSRGS